MTPSRTPLCTPLRLMALSAALLAGTAIAHAQTVTRQITTEPVETIITQQPDGSTVVTRRPIADRPAEVLPPPAVRYAPAATSVAEETYAEPPVAKSGTVGVRNTTTGARRATTTRHVSTVTPRTRTSRSVTRTTVARRAPLVLTPSERRIVYQTIVQREVYPSADVAVARAPVYGTYGGPVVRSYDYDTTYSAPLASPPVVAEEDVVEPPAPVPYPATTGYAPRSYAATYVVGSRIPASVPLVTVPETIAARVPAVRDYGYVSVGGRVYLVDPATSTVVADIPGQY
jgi:hypothetical protein